VGFLAILNAGIASTRAAVTVGVNVLIMSGKETGITNVFLIVCQVKNCYIVKGKNS